MGTKPFSRLYSVQVMENGSKELVIVGSGNVAQALLAAFSVKTSYRLGNYARNTEEGKRLSQSYHSHFYGSLAEIPSAALVVLCVNDDAIATVMEQFPTQQALVYTAGSVALDELPKRPLTGVFYPMQSMSKGKTIDFSNVPICIEATTDVLKTTLMALAKSLSANVIPLTSEERLRLHLAAVMVNNFSNHLVELAKRQISSTSLNWRILLPLLEEQLEKLQSMTPSEAQTGPAIRGDQRVIEKHQHLLEGRTKALYSLFTESIQHTE